MRRLIIAIALILSCLILSICELSLVDNNYDKYTTMINDAEIYFSKKEYTKAQKITQMANSNWSKEEKKLKVFLLHSDVEEVTDSMRNIKEYAQNKEEKEFFYACKKIKRQLLSIKESELPYIENIL